MSNNFKQIYFFLFSDVFWKDVGCAKAFLKVDKSEKTKDKNVLFVLI